MRRLKEEATVSALHPGALGRHTLQPFLAKPQKQSKEEMTGAAEKTERSKGVKNGAAQAQSPDRVSKGRRMMTRS